MEGLPLADSEHPGLRLASEARAEIESLGGVVETAILIKDLREAYKDTITGKLGNALRALKELEKCLMQQSPLCQTRSNAEQEDIDGLASNSSESPARTSRTTRTLGPRATGSEKLLSAPSTHTHPPSSSSVLTSRMEVTQASQREVRGTYRTQPYQTRLSTTKCERCGNTKILEECHGFIKEAGLACQRFAEMPDGMHKLSHYRSLYHWRCPHRTCDFHVARNCKAPVCEGSYLLSYEQREELVWKHQRECTHERIQRTALSRTTE